MSHSFKYYIFYNYLIIKVSGLLIFICLTINVINGMTKNTFNHIMDNNEEIKFDYYIINETNYAITDIVKYYLLI